MSFSVAQMHFAGATQNPRYFVLFAGVFLLNVVSATFSPFGNSKPLN